MLKCILARSNEPMKSENQIIVRCKQPIKIEKPFQSLLTFPCIAGERNILQTILLSFFSVFILSMPSKVLIIVIALFLGINIFWALLRAHFNPRLTVRAKMSLSPAQNIFMPVNINSIVLLLLPLLLLAKLLLLIVFLLLLRLLLLLLLLLLLSLIVF